MTLEKLIAKAQKLIKNDPSKKDMDIFVTTKFGDWVEATDFEEYPYKEDYIGAKEHNILLLR